MPMPEEIVGLLRSTITIKWDDGHETKYRARDLRLACRCALCIEETSGRPLLEPSTVPENVRAKGHQPGRPVRDRDRLERRHSSGIYNFRDLRAQLPLPGVHGEADAVATTVRSCRAARGGSARAAC
jgi:ATP-binding protein involved in chromosome partitioning